MQYDNDPNVIYGGDPDEESEAATVQYASLGEMIFTDLRLGENKTFFINGLTDACCTYGDLLEQSSTICRALYGAGIKQNDVIAIISENRHEYPAIAYGAIYNNAIVAPINATYTERELIHALDLSKPKLVFVSPFAVNKVSAVCKKLKFVKNIVVIGGIGGNDSYTLSLNDFIKKNEVSKLNIEELVKNKVDLIDQVALVFCSSGTTGMAKGVLITHNNVITVVQSYRELIPLKRMILGKTIVVLNITPWFHALGFITMTISACSREVSCVYLPKFEEEPYLRAIEKYRVNQITVVPPIMVFLAKTPLFDKYDLSSITDINCGAASLSKDIEEQVRARFKQDVLIRQAYGMTELSLGSLSSTLIVKPGSVGEVVKGVYVKVIDENGKSLGPHQEGELCFKGKLLMKGYIGDQQATSATIDKDGWLHTGDIGYYDDDKHFFIVDRIKELIKYKAFQVPPAEIEGLLLSNSKIKDCGVIGIPDEEAGELPFAFVVKQPGVELTEQEVKNFVADNASKPKWLRGGVRFVDSIPKTLSGKLLRREMRETYKNTKSKL